MKIFLDIDGVLGDFCGHYCDMFNDVNEYYQPGYSYAYLDSYRAMAGIPWKTRLALDPEIGYKYWRTMKKTPEADCIVNQCIDTVGAANTIILTTPMRFAGCAQAKIEWVHEHYPNLSVLISVEPFDRSSDPPKWACACEDSVLIDDCDINCANWHDAGGGYLKWGRPWNDAWPLEAANIERLESFLGVLV